MLYTSPVLSSPLLHTAFYSILPSPIPYRLLSCQAPSSLQPPVLFKTYPPYSLLSGQVLTSIQPLDLSSPILHIASCGMKVYPPRRRLSGQALFLNIASYVYKSSPPYNVIQYLVKPYPAHSLLSCFLYPPNSLLSCQALPVLHPTSILPSLILHTSSYLVKPNCPHSLQSYQAQYAYTASFVVKPNPFHRLPS